MDVMVNPPNHPVNVMNNLRIFSDVKNKIITKALLVYNTALFLNFITAIGIIRSNLRDSDIIYYIIIFNVILYIFKNIISVYRYTWILPNIQTAVRYSLDSERYIRLVILIDLLTITIPINFMLFSDTNNTYILVIILTGVGFIIQTWFIIAIARG